MAERAKTSSVSFPLVSFLTSRACGLYLRYNGLNFCVSEIMGEGCQVPKSAKVEEVYQSQDETSCPLQLMDKIGMSPLPDGKKTVEFKVY